MKKRSLGFKVLIAEAFEDACGSNKRGIDEKKQKAMVVVEI